VDRDVHGDVLQQVEVRGEVRHAGELEGDGSREAITEVRWLAVVLSTTPARRGF
jgi:hypothetical protein